MAISVTITGGDLPPKEFRHYIEHCVQKYEGKHIKHIDINVDGDYVDMNVEFED